MVSYLDLDPNAPFASVFSDKGMVGMLGLPREQCLPN